MANLTPDEIDAASMDYLDNHASHEERVAALADALPAVVEAINFKAGMKVVKVVYGPNGEVIGFRKLVPYA